MAIFNSYVSLPEGNKIAIDIAENDHYCGWWITMVGITRTAAGVY